MADSVALVIRTKGVELLAMRGKRVMAKATAPVESTEPSQLALAIKSAMEIANVKTKKVAVSIEHPDVLFRFFTLPALPKPEWDGAVQFESRRYIPFRPDALAWDYHAVQPKGATALEVVFAALPKPAFDGLREALAGADLQASSIEPRALSLARLLDVSKAGGPNEFVCLVDIEPHTAHLAVAKRAMPYMTRDINFSRAVEPQSPAAPIDPAQMTLVDPAAPAGEAAAVPDLSMVGMPLHAEEGADPRVQRLLSELSVSMDFFMREYPSTTVSKVVLFGDQELVTSWVEWLGSRLTCPVESGEALLAKRVQGGLDLSWASAVGVLEAKGPETIDFLRKHAGAKPGESKGMAADLKSVDVAELLVMLKTPQAVICVAVAGAMLLALWFGGEAMTSGLRRRLQQASQNRPDVGWGLNQLTTVELDPIKTKAESQLAVLKRLMDQQVSLAAKLDALSRTTPEGVWITNLTYDGSFDAFGMTAPRLVLAGACYRGGGQEELRAIQAFEEEIKKNAPLFQGFKHLDVGQISMQGTGPGEEYAYRTFQMNLLGENRL